MKELQTNLKFFLIGLFNNVIFVGVAILKLFCGYFKIEKMDNVVIQLGARSHVWEKKDKIME